MIEPMDGECQAELIEELIAYGIEDRRVLDVMAKLYRADFMPPDNLLGFDPYEDAPADIGAGQTISQPYIVAYMSELLQPRAGQRILEIGTGSGYQAAVLASLGAELYTIERIERLYNHAQKVLEPYAIQQRLGNGIDGWPEAAPFDAIIATCAAREIPQALIEQLAEGGTMVIPLGADNQHLEICIKKDAKLQRSRDLAVRFVPFVEKL